MQRNLKRSRIMQVATDLFSSFGYHAVGVDWIIRDADISKNTLYKYFFSKENLILEVLKERDRACRESLSQLIPNELPPIQKLEWCLIGTMNGLPQRTLRAVYLPKQLMSSPVKPMKSIELLHSKKSS